MWAVWLIFLVFPLLAILREPDHGPLWRGAGVTLIVAFGIVYTGAAVQLMRFEPDYLRPALTALAGLLVIATLSIPFLGSNIISYTPFLISLAAFSLPRPWHWVFGVVTIAATVVVMIVTDDVREWLSFIFILIAIAVAVNAARFFVEQSEGYDDMRQGLAISAERERVARDVHDVLGHSLTVVSVKAALAERLVDLDPERAKSEIADIARLSRESLAEIRATVGGLRAAQLATELGAARDSLRSAGIDADIPPDAQVVDPAHRTVLGWVLREAVTNVVRHSGAGRCRVELRAHGLVVEDDGVGIRDRRMGNGLRGLRERVEQSGGNFTIGSGSDGSGTRLEASWPS